MTCREAGPLLHARLDNELDMAGAASIDLHLDECRACAAHRPQRYGKVLCGDGEPAECERQRRKPRNNEGEANRADNASG